MSSVPVCRSRFQFSPSRIIAQGEVKSVENFLLYLSKLVKFNSTYSVYFYPSILRDIRLKYFLGGISALFRPCRFCSALYLDRTKGRRNWFNRRDCPHSNGHSIVYRALDPSAQGSMETLSLIFERLRSYDSCSRDRGGGERVTPNGCSRVIVSSGRVHLRTCSSASLTNLMDT